jgi:DNA-binding protein YbaB
MTSELHDPHSVARLRRLADDVRTIRDQVDDLETEADSPDGQIHATVNGRGDLLDLAVSERTFRNPDSTGLAAAITETVRDAQQQANREIARICAETFPAAPD